MPTALNLRQEKAAKLSGRAVLVMLVAFFGVVIAVNLVMLKLAVQSFSGLEEKNAYLAGMSHDRALAAVRAQDARGWRVEARLDRPAPGRSRVLVTRGEAEVDAPVEQARALAGGLQARVRFEHPADSRQDRVLALAPVRAGAWSGALELPAGAWDLAIELHAGEDVLFRSRSRVQVRD